MNSLNRLLPKIRGNMFKELMWNEAENKIASTKDIVFFVEFTTKWCNDCKVMKPIVDSLAEQYSEDANIQFIKIDAEDSELFRNYTNKLQILKVPTHMIFLNNEIINKGYEYWPKEILNSWIEKALSLIEKEKIDY